MATIDSYSETNRNDLIPIRKVHPSSTTDLSAAGHSFITPNDGQRYKITSVKFHLAKVVEPTGSLTFKLYDHSGTYGTSSVPTGAALATSDALDVSTLTTSFVLYELAFTGAQQYTMEINTNYCIVAVLDSGVVNTTNYITVGIDTSSPTHGGNFIKFASSAWGYNDAYDTIFYVFGEVVSAAPARIASRRMLVGLGM